MSSISLILELACSMLKSYGINQFRYGLLFLQMRISRSNDLADQMLSREKYSIKIDDF